MRALNLRSLLVAVVVFAAPSIVAAQLPSPQQAQQMLQNNPQLVEQLRQRIMTSGMTPDQVRERLREEGYPENLLDAYLPGGGAGGAGGAGTTGGATGMGAADVFSAVRELGVADTTGFDMLRCTALLDSVAFADSVTRSGGRGNGAVPLGTVNAGASDSALVAAFGPDTAGVRSRLLQIRACREQAARQRQVTTAAPADSGFNIFGLDFFRRSTSQFNPNTGGPVDAGYRLGPGDRLVLVLTGDVEASYTLDVTREGFVVIPQVGEVYVNGLTLAQLNDILYTRLGRVYSGVTRGADATTHFSVTPARVRSNLVYVVGDVLRPGAYQISAAGTLLTALYASGGPTDNGTLRDLQVRRNGRVVGHMDFYDYLINGDASHDIRLQDGDIVFVPVHLGRVRVVGEIVRPATYEIRPNETLADALRFAGGFKATASRQRVQIERIVPPTERTAGRDRITTDIVSDAFLTGTGPAVPVQPGDVIRVFPVTTRVHNRVFVDGDVNTPGTVGLTPGMRLSDVLRLAGGLKSDAYLGEVLVSRLNPDSTRTQLRAMLRDTTGAVVNDFPIHEDDEVHVFSVTEFRPARYVAINGAVQHPGQYAYREGMTLRDLVLMAGGLQQSALLNEAKVARLPADRSTGITAREFSVPLDSSYLFERSPDGRYFGPPGLPAPGGPSPEVGLDPYDNVLVLRQPNWELQRTVAVTGEVRYPGTYTLLSKNERISDVLKRAGGLTPEGYANGVLFYRRREGIGRIGIELPDVLRNPRDLDNLLLQDGDSLYIPRYNAVVRVQGAVNSPVAVTYVPGRDIRYYIRAAGGFSRTADEGRAYVTQPNGKVDAEQRRFLIPDHIPQPLPGSVVTVPTRDPNERGTDPIAILGALSGIVSSLVAIVAVIHK